MAGDITVQAIRGVDFTIMPASFVAFVGPSGSGKSTLLNTIGCSDQPTIGNLEIAGIAVLGSLSPAWKAAKMDPITALRQV